MARDSNYQHQGTVVRHDYGYVTLSAAGVGTVSTVLSQVHSGVAVHRSGNFFATPLRVGALSSGSVTITDPAGVNNASATVFYHLMGV